MNDIAKIFWNGRSQAVRLPKDYRFEGREVRIRRDGDKVILEPMLIEEKDNQAWVSSFAGIFGRDFAQAALDRPGPDRMPAGPDFD